ncbi:MAG: hypothetical protein Q9159_001735 [Coniocarpon cinnabarinum]
MARTQLDAGAPTQSTLVTAPSTAVSPIASPGGTLPAAGAANTSPAQAAAATNSSNSSGLSARAIVGVAVGVGAFLILLLVTLALFFLWRRSNRARDGSDTMRSGKSYDNVGKRHTATAIDAAIAPSEDSPRLPDRITAGNAPLHHAHSPADQSQSSSVGLNAQEPTQPFELLTPTLSHGGFCRPETATYGVSHTGLVRPAPIHLTDEMPQAPVAEAPDTQIRELQAERLSEIREYERDVEKQKGVAWPLKPLLASPDEKLSNAASMRPSTGRPSSPVIPRDDLYMPGGAI